MSYNRLAVDIPKECGTAMVDVAIGKFFIYDGYVYLKLGPGRAVALETGYMRDFMGNMNVKVIPNHSTITILVGKDYVASKAYINQE